ncbi:hypothetical protein DCAR_0935702 [Daucus carota subsp. sativus]|uniref:Uncharacterized protein n=1 Tax=Daucus carota subsp. sativus TaxID=79200 RepID=A0A175YJ33_DAUCS|nr:hypothetical protein DCAR_0935702 [Daucus carota subsp. sativus]
MMMEQELSQENRYFQP